MKITIIANAIVSCRIFRRDSQKTSPPARPASIHSFPGNKFAGDRANDRSDKEPEDAEEHPDENAEDGAECSPSGGAEIFCAEITAHEIDEIAGERQQDEDSDDASSRCFFPAPSIMSMNDSGGENNGRSGKHGRTVPISPIAKSSHR